MKGRLLLPVQSLLILLGLSAALGATANPCQQIEQAKVKHYGFKPSRLSQEEQEEKAKELDTFWNLVKSHGGDGITCLQELLQNDTRDGYFVFDGSILLYELDQSPESLHTISRALLHASLEDINRISYISLVQQLSHKGIDIGPLADKYLISPHVEGYLAMHALRVDRAMGALFLYASMPPGQVDQHLIPHLKSDIPEVRSTAALLLAFNMTEESLRALAQFEGWNNFNSEEKQLIRLLVSPRPSRDVQPSKNREEVLTLLERIPEYSDGFYGVAGNKELIKSAIENLNQTDLDMVREARRRSMMSVSDERLYEHYALTEILIGLIERFGLYKDYLHSLRALE